jgi:tRNA A-37 threonylcarbamoyl transferase component Bud32
MNKELLDIINHFESLGEDFVVGNRNKIKIIPYNDVVLNIKSFKVPSFINGVIYRFFRKSKAKRSFIYAKVLKDNNIGTPEPIAFYENKTWLRLLDSYYICEHLEVDYVFKELFNKDIPELDEILRQFAHFCFKLHEAGIEFLDHSPGNTLIKKRSDGAYDFYLVDLNRMKFHNKMDFTTRMRNLRRITPSEYMVKVISSEYAKLYNKTETEVFEEMWKHNVLFHKKFDRKRLIKKRFNIK